MLRLQCDTYGGHGAGIDFGFKKHIYNVDTALGYGLDQAVGNLVAMLVNIVRACSTLQQVSYRVCLSVLNRNRDQRLALKRPRTNESSVE
mgnify:FL=1